MGGHLVYKLFIVAVLTSMLSLMCSGTRRPISDEQVECVCSNATDCVTKTCDYGQSDEQDIDIIYSDVQKWKKLIVQNARNVELHRTAIAESIEINNVPRVTILYRYDVPDSKAFKTLIISNSTVVGNRNISFNTLDVLHLSNSKIGAVEQNKKAFKEIDITDSSEVEILNVRIYSRKSTFQDSRIKKIELLQIENAATFYMDNVQMDDILSLTYTSSGPATITNSSVKRIGANSIVVHSTATSSALELRNVKIGEIFENAIRVEGDLKMRDTEILFAPNDGIVIKGNGKIHLENVTINGISFSVSLAGVTGNGSVNLLEMWTQSNAVNNIIFGVIIALLLVIIVGLIIWRVIESLGKSKGKEPEINVSKGKLDPERSMSANLYERKQQAREIPLTQKNPMPLPDPSPADQYDPPSSLDLNQVSTEPDDSSFADLPPPPPPPIEEEMPTYEDVDYVKSDTSFLHNQSMFNEILKKKETKSGNVSDRLVQKTVTSNQPLLDPKPIFGTPSPISQSSKVPKQAAPSPVPAYPPLSSIPNSALYYKRGGSKPPPPLRKGSAAAQPPVALTPGYTDSALPLYDNTEVNGEEEEEPVYESEEYNPQ